MANPFKALQGYVFDTAAERNAVPMDVRNLLRALDDAKHMTVDGCVQWSSVQKV